MRAAARIASSRSLSVLVIIEDRAQWFDMFASYYSVVLPGLRDDMASAVFATTATALAPTGLAWDFCRADELPRGFLDGASVVISRHRWWPPWRPAPARRISGGRMSVVLVGCGASSRMANR
ncbi:hypothetical protein [Actinoplanes sp. N902-109]|uniref:hypothetical protein n=1 Tax=Actinoplanes sp. (strain N902-109) TaxID=649831 RepID=UPI0012FA7835|nr:hypothetical protein [Actinoplanes sp. N902-109]